VKIEKDKQLHFVAGFVVGLAAAVALNQPAVAMVAAALAGVVKEGYDLWQNRRASKKHLIEPHTVEKLDVLWTLIGGVAAAGAFALFKLLPT
jgi:uncharacterized iron-regulated membrane protein